MPPTTWTVVVVGDVARSPRMCYHALSLAQKPETYVNLVGYYGKGYGNEKEGEMRNALGDVVGGCERLRPVPMRAPPDFIDYLPTSILRYTAKMMLTFFALLIVLLRVVPYGSERRAGMLLQNPPGLPSMLVCWLVAKCKNSRYFIDWHNYTYTMLDYKLGAASNTNADLVATQFDQGNEYSSRSCSTEEDCSSGGDRSKSRGRCEKGKKIEKGQKMTTLKLLPRVAQKLEHYLAPKADGHLCVSRAMRQDLTENWSIKAVTLYDRPPKWRFSVATLEDRHVFLTKLATELMYPPFVCTQTSDDEIEANRFTYRDACSKKIRSRGLGRPALLVSSTSWSPDEDFSILLCALKLYDDFVTDQRNRGGSDGSTRLPHIVMVITGKGPLKETYLRLMDVLDLQHVEIVTPWLQIQDYPKMLQVADLGVCLHMSTSGLDLPMKVVDMHGCGLPALCYQYNCIDELIVPGHTGHTFSNAAELAHMFVRLLGGFPEVSKATFSPFVTLYPQPKFTQEGSFFHHSSQYAQKRPRTETSDSSSDSSSDTAENLKSLEKFVQQTVMAYDGKFKDMDKKHEVVDKKLTRVENTLRVVHRDLTKSDLRIMNVSRKLDNGDMRDAHAAFRLILSEGLGFDQATVGAICEKTSLQRCYWQQQRSRAQGGGRGGAAAAAGLENSVIFIRLANDDDVMMILKEKTKERFRDYKLGCQKPVGIDRNYTAEDKWDRNRAFEVARAFCEKKGLDRKKDVKMKGKAFEYQGVTKTYEQWLVSENLTVDRAKMGDSWVPPKPDQPSTSSG